jgi:hypothetical protein
MNNLINIIRNNRIIEIELSKEIDRNYKFDLDIAIKYLTRVSNDELNIILDDSINNEESVYYDFIEKQQTNIINSYKMIKKLKRKTFLDRLFIIFKSLPLNIHI